jgi:hypothetical protein
LVSTRASAPYDLPVKTSTFGASAKGKALIAQSPFATAESFSVIGVSTMAVAVPLVSLIAGPAHAGQLLSPPLWTDVGNVGVCYVRNIGTAPFTVHVTLFSNNGIAPGDIVVDSCNSGPLGAGKTCVIFAQALPDASWAACSAQASNTNVSKLRGNMDIRNSFAAGARVVVAEDLR